MAKNFIPPPNQINSISTKQSARSYSDNSSPSIFHELKKVVRDSHTDDVFASVGQLNAIVVEVCPPVDPSIIAYKYPVTNYAYNVLGKVPDFIEIRYRVPELHAHLPEPTSSTDYAAINRHPFAIMKKEKGTPVAGDIVTLDFADKNNFTGATVSETFNTSEVPTAVNICKPADVFNSAPPPLNMSQPTGDSQDSAKGEYSAKNNPADDAFTFGIEYPQSESVLESFEYLKKNMYIISLDDWQRLPIFKSNRIDNVVESMIVKQVFSICFTVAEGSVLIDGQPRLKTLIHKLRKSGITCNLAIHATGEDINPALIHASSILRDAPCTGIYWRIPEGSIGLDISESDVQRIDQLFRTMSTSRNMKYGIIDTNRQPLHPTPPMDSPQMMFLSDNIYDFNKKGRSAYQSPLWETLYPDAHPFYHLGGTNLLQTPAEPCINGKRTLLILNAEILSRRQYYIFDGFEFLSDEIVGLIAQKTRVEPTSDDKQNLLSSIEKTSKVLKANVEGIIGVQEPRLKDSPSFNSDEPSTQTSLATPPAAFTSAPGSACSPGAGGGAMGDLGGAPGAAVTPPSFRFDSIENYSNLGWTANNSATINDVIFDFMERFSAAIYRRLPRTSPSIAGSVYKKIRLTSTARTTTKQVELMWDKIKNGGGDSAVYKLYGNKDWTRGVVEAYHSNNKPAAVASVEARLAAGGGSAHLSGRGIDIHTWSHLDAEGITSSKASIATMKTSKYVQAIIAACAETNAKPTVEAYQQHVHITIR
jgi:hypothetical protein